MPLIFDNPAGALALLGVPVILGIHLLQARSRKTPAATLFLLDRLAPESRGGLRLERLRRSLPLALRLLAVLVCTWLLVQPRFVRPDASQRVAVVLDSSLSMDASRDRMVAALPDRLASLTRFAARTEFILTESDTRRAVVYHGEDMAALRAALASWRPVLGEHDVMPALTQAALSVRGAGVVVFVTDKPGENRGGAATLSFGAPMDNCGFAGSSVESDENGRRWSALVRNYGRAPRTLDWRVTVDGVASPPQVLSLAAGQIASLAGAFPESARRLSVHLTPDSFAADDTLPLVNPALKRIRVFNALDGADGKLVARVLAGIDGVESVADSTEADVRYARHDAPGPVKGTPSVLFAPVDTRALAPTGPVLAEAHPFTAETGWQGLNLASTAGAAAGESDLPLVWRGATPIVSLRPTAPGRPSLVIDFSPETTNAAKLPAFVVLLRRHLEAIRETLPRAYALNTDTHRLCPPVYDAARGPLRVSYGDADAVPLGAREATVFRAPDRPAYFTIRQGDVALMTGAAQFGDVREADLLACGPADTLQARETALAHASSVPDPWRPVWLALLAVLLPLIWWAQRAHVRPVHP